MHLFRFVLLPWEGFRALIWLLTFFVKVLLAAGAHCGLRSVCVFGGVPIHQQMGELKQGVHALVATPGRLLSLVRSGRLSLSQVSFVVLDEADRMLDLGFEPDIRAILGAVRPLSQRQTLLFSATWPEAVQKLAHEFVKDPVTIRVGTESIDFVCTVFFCIPLSPARQNPLAARAPDRSPCNQPCEKLLPCP